MIDLIFRLYAFYCTLRCGEKEKEETSLYQTRWSPSRHQLYLEGVWVGVDILLTRARRWHVIVEEKDARAEDEAASDNTQKERKKSQGT